MNTNSVKKMSEILSNLDLTPTMYKNALEKKDNLIEYLADNGLKVDIRFQGSFSIGTLTRPYNGLNNSDKEYDVDMICIVDFEKSEENRTLIRNQILHVLNNSDIYKSRLTIYDKCFTISYSDISDCNFNIDLVPAIYDNSEINNIISKSKDYSDYKYIVDIAGRNKYLISNPAGYRNWFEKINILFPSFSDTLVSNFFEGFKESVPDYFKKSNLQKCIQLLKRHCSVFYYKAGNNNPPPSIIITTLAAEIASGLPNNIDLFEMINIILIKIKNYNNYLKLSEEVFYNIYPNEKLIKKNNGKWILINPVNSFDNLTDSWNNNDASTFFKWIDAALNDFKSFDTVNDDELFVNFSNAFGTKFINEISKKGLPKSIDKDVKPYHA